MKLSATDRNTSVHIITQEEMDAADALLGVDDDSQPSETELAQIHAKMRSNNKDLKITKASM